MKHGHGDLEASLVLIFPVLLAYEIGVLFCGNVSGADVVTRALYLTLGTRTLYLLVHAAIALLFLLWIRRGNRWGSLRMEIALPVVLEAAIYAFTLGAAIQLVLRHVLHLSLDGDSAISALGAGVHEELVFRLGLMCGIVSMMRESRGAFPVALIISSLLFAGAHHLGPHGEPLTAHAFAFRALAGAAFGAIFWYRSLAHAVYAHVLYDLVIAAS
ncbi:MAG TPA: CPBP family intramembrane glutamic endopeptidase [Kofleriaceae bacterium]|nr:CPBP family intramembrane glutamic endopeptidase [Kofleriaceae bacterium]